MKALVLAALVACSSGTARPKEPADSTIAPMVARVDAAVDAAIAAQHVVGTVVVIARDGKVVYARAAGFADRESKVPMREDTIFRLASMTKPIVSVAALALIDQGKLSLDEAVTKYLPAFRPKLADGREPVITVRHLLTHTSGLGYHFIVGDAYDGVSDGLAEPGLAADKNLAVLASKPLRFEPGTKWEYGLSIDVLGEVVARAGGGSLQEVVDRLVANPAGMRDTAFVVRDRERIAWPYAAGKPPVRMAEPHTVSEQGMTVTFSPARIFDAASFPSGGAGMAGTARDYVAFLEALRTGKLTKQPFDQNQIGTIDGGFMGPGNRFGFGFGIVVDPAAAKSNRGAGSYGWGGIYGTGFWIDPVAKLTVVIMTNTAGDTPFDPALDKAIYGR